MKLTLTMVTIDSADPAPLAAWWAARLEAPIVQENEGWFYVIDATPLLAIQKVEDPTPGKNRLHLDLNAPDLDAARDDLLDAGASLIAEHGDESFRWVTLADPQGNQFCIAQH